MEISHPRRILAVSHPDSGLIDLVTGLTGNLPILPEGTSTLAGSTHTLPLKTPYYSASIPIWLDELTTPSLWAQEFLAPEAREVLTVLGAFIVVFRKPSNEKGLEEVKKLLEAVGEVVKEGCGLVWDGACLAVAMPGGEVPKVGGGREDWEGLCGEWGFEFVDWEEKGRNEFSEPLGLERLKEALETNDWEGIDLLEDALGLDDFEGEDNFDDDDDDDESLGFGIGKEEMKEEMKGMKQAIYGPAEGPDEEGEVEGDGDDEVEKLQAMMAKMQAVRDLGADMPEAERKRFAAKAVSEIMKTL